MFLKAFQVNKSFEYEDWNAFSRWRMKEFWENRGFRFGEISHNRIVGSRGSIWGNLFSFRQVDLLASLSITPAEKGLIDCELTINTSMQIITTYDFEFWELEVETFGSFLLSYDLKESEWKNLQSRWYEMWLEIFGLSSEKQKLLKIKAGK